MIISFDDYISILSQIEDFYDNIGLRYEYIYPNLKESNEALASSILKSIEIPSDGKIGDLGSSIGVLLNEIANLDPEKKLFGFDISNESVKYAKTNFETKHKNLTYEISDWLKINEKSDCNFDLLLCLGNSLSHYPLDIQKEILCYWSKLLKPNGYLLVDSYIDWNKKLEQQEYIYEPKGLTENNSEKVISNFFSIYEKDIAVRNILFGYYDKKSFSLPQKYEHFVTYQFPIIFNENFIVSDVNFSSVKKVDLEDKVRIFEYYLLRK